MYAEEEWSGVMLAQPESLGVESITAAGVTMRVQVRTTNADQWRVARELRQRLSERFAAEGFKAPVPLLAGAAASSARAS
jgi:small-conductance mechanosensitive channel